MIGKTKCIAQREGIIFILSAPSGTGKTTLIKGLRAVYPDIRLSVSFTTRARRAEKSRLRLLFRSVYEIRQ